MTSKPRKSLQRKNPSGVARRKSFERRKSFYQPEEFADREFPLVYKPKMIKKVGDYCYFFHCTIKGNTGNRFNKNMAVLLYDGEVIVINPLRLTEEGEDKLLELSTTRTVSHILRLGPSEHAAFEDDYYLARFEGCQRWAPGPFPGCPHLPIHHILYDTTNTRTLSLDAPIAPPSPHPDIQIFVFEETVEPEAILFLLSKRTLIAGDCLQCQQNNPFINDGAANYLTKHGLMEHKVVLSDTWVTSQSVVTSNSRKLNNSFKSRAQKAKSFFGNTTGRYKLRNDFQRLLKLDIARLASASGNHVLLGEGTEVKEEISKAVDRVCQ